MPETPCDVDDCPKDEWRKLKDRSLCVTHYMRVVRYGSTDPRPRKPPKVLGLCKAKGCPDMEKRGRAGYCDKHYTRNRIHGDPLFEFSYGTDRERFEAKVNRDGPLPKWAPFLGPCWIWTGHITDVGYGTMAWGGKKHGYTHRYAYTEFVGPIPAGLDLDHNCRVTACCNPAHTEPVTRKENLRRARERLGIGEYATHCKHGHLWAENERIGKNGRRSCGACQRDYDRRRRPRNPDRARAAA